MKPNHVLLFLLVFTGSCKDEATPLQKATGRYRMTGTRVYVVQRVSDTSMYDTINPPSPVELQFILDDKPRACEALIAITPENQVPPSGNDHVLFLTWSNRASNLCRHHIYLDETGNLSIPRQGWHTKGDNILGGSGYLRNDTLRLTFMTANNRVELEKYVLSGVKE